MCPWVAPFACDARSAHLSFVRRLCYETYVSPDVITAKIRRAIPDAEVTLRDLTGGGDHWEAVVVSEVFTGRSLIEQHRLVFDALAEEMKGPIHALTLKTFAAPQPQR